MEIITKRPASLAEVKELMPEPKERKPVHDYIKEFTKLSEEKARSCIEKLRELNNPKLSDTILVKIVDFLPEDMDDLNKIFNESSLSDEEGQAILEILKKF